MLRLGPTEVHLTPVEEEVRKTYTKLVESGMGPLEALHTIENLIVTDSPEHSVLMDAQFRDWLLS